jgi:hypothetical protein
MQIVTVAISILAALVSILSAWISFRNVRQTQRTRLGRPVDEMSKGEWEFDRESEEDGAQVAESVVADFNVRQEILARQALAIFPSFRGSVSSREPTVVAGTLGHIDDYSGVNHANHCRHPDCPHRIRHAESCAEGWRTQDQALGINRTSANEYIDGDHWSPKLT